ncbi:hypothetical protein AZI87_12850 [Bdellovibrio bacteriovorus]|uniref:Uncharacterized protein n=1 Tax=Bdellovibrio bacteriovorus TaxID=959 RepID=A0A162GA98_BDEBC|nr:hypothetical protein [Bdellovibrio bacteriovorus]KYG65422.1 hypothetical protein AZI87_12850 [Bdellovibrio bacteriovorus]
MNLKTILLTSAVAMMLGACAHTKSHDHAGCNCGHKTEMKKECSGTECAVDKKCADCQKSEAATAK